MTWRSSTVMAVLALTGAVFAAGCETELFPKAEPRSPFERYATLRGKQRPATETNVWGGEQPALRERLKPMNAP